MSLFGDLDVQAAADDPFAVKEGTYEAVVAKAEAKTSNDGSKTGFAINYTITGADDPEMIGRSLSEWKNIPKAEDESPEAKRDASFLKQRLLSLGVPEAKVNVVTSEDLIGTEVVVVAKNTPDKNDPEKIYTNVTKVEVAKGGSAKPASKAAFK